MLVKIHKADGKTVIALCDKELIGKKFQEGNKQLDLSGEFYNGEDKDPIEVGDLIRNADIVNIVGERSIKLALEEGVIDQEHIIEIEGIPHAQSIQLYT